MQDKFQNLTDSILRIDPTISSHEICEQTNNLVSFFELLIQINEQNDEESKYEN